MKEPYKKIDKDKEEKRQERTTKITHEIKEKKHDMGYQRVSKKNYS